MIMKTANYQPLSPLLFIERTKQVYGSKLAIIDEDTALSYEEFYQECVNVAKSLTALGIKPQQKVAYLCSNNQHMLIAHYAIPMVGAILVPINIKLNPAEVIFILEHSGATFLILNAEHFNDSFSSIIKNVVIIPDKNTTISENNKFITYDLFIKKGKKIENFFPYDNTDENSVITINYTSGTTGSPKGIMYSYRSSYLNALGECLQAGLTSKSKYLWVLPMYHCNGWCFTWAVTAVAATHICMSRFDPEHAIDLIVKHAITHFCAAPTVLGMLAEANNFHLLKNIKSLSILIAGAPPSVKLIELYENYNIRIIHVYGLTETYGPHVICEEQEEWQTITAEERARLKANQGVSGIHSVFTRVVAANDSDVPPDGVTLGEVVMRGNNVMLGYYNDPQATQQAFRNGWFHSGDLAVITKDGYIKIKDRIKDIVISGGENISSIEVENVISQLQEVRDVAVIGEPHKKWGMVPHAIIELKKGYKLDKQAVIDHCRLNLAHFKCPRRITFANLPRISTGKIQKRLLKQIYVSNVERN